MKQTKTGVSPLQAVTQIYPPSQKTTGLPVDECANNQYATARCRPEAEADNRVVAEGEDGYFSGFTRGAPSDKKRLNDRSKEFMFGQQPVYIGREAVKSDGYSQISESRMRASLGVH